MYFKMYYLSITDLIYDLDLSFKPRCIIMLHFSY